jgi:c-di-GMP-binding flagellar brake protein YcgR
MKQKRLHKRFSAELPVKLQAITSRRFRVLNVETKDISASGAFLYTEEASYIPDDTRFILNSTSPEKKRIRLKELRQLENCTGTLARSTSEGIAIHFNRPVKLFV